MREEAKMAGRYVFKVISPDTLEIFNIQIEVPKIVAVNKPLQNQPESTRRKILLGLRQIFFSKVFVGLLIGCFVIAMIWLVADSLIPFKARTTNEIINTIVFVGLLFLCAISLIIIAVKGIKEEKQRKKAHELDEARKSKVREQINERVDRRANDSAPQEFVSSEILDRPLLINDCLQIQDTIFVPESFVIYRVKCSWQMSYKGSLGVYDTYTIELVRNDQTIVLWDPRMNFSSGSGTDVQGFADQRSDGAWMLVIKYHSNPSISAWVTGWNWKLTITPLTTADGSIVEP